MSDVHEFVLWESKGGSWNAGVFHVVDSDSPTCVDYSAFVSVSVGHSTKEEAERHLMMAHEKVSDSRNTDSFEDVAILPYKGNSAASHKFDYMALQFRDPVAALANRHFMQGRDMRRGHQILRCLATTKDGSPCQNIVVVKGRRCHVHRYL